ncbi:unnamed protein product [Linum trigynum]|uniref:Uncharacterized protein n=1 Tax=Linum trigynum TaxID=586398 RepID=A0AAV2CV76_9ROSI
MASPAARRARAQPSPFSSDSLPKSISPPLGISHLRLPLLFTTSSSPRRRELRRPQPLDIFVFLFSSPPATVLDGESYAADCRFLKPTTGFNSVHD